MNPLDLCSIYNEKYLKGNVCNDTYRDTYYLLNIFGLILK